jgi:hypothetical protein
VFPVVMAEVGVKEPPIAGHAAIRVLKQHMVKEPIFGAASSRPVELFATAIGTTRDLSLKGGFVHGENLLPGRAMLQRVAVEAEAQFVPPTGSLSSKLRWNLGVSPGKRPNRTCGYWIGDVRLRELFLLEWRLNRFVGGQIRRFACDTLWCCPR